VLFVKWYVSSCVVGTFGFGVTGIFGFGFGLDFTGGGSNGAEGTSFLHDINNKNAINTIRSFITTVLYTNLRS